MHPLDCLKACEDIPDCQACGATPGAFFGGGLKNEKALAGLGLVSH